MKGPLRDITYILFTTVPKGSNLRWLKLQFAVRDVRLMLVIKARHIKMIACPLARSTLAQILGFTAQRLALVAAAALTVAAPFGGLLVSLVLAGCVAWYVDDDPIIPPARRRWQEHQ